MALDKKPDAKTANTIQFDTLNGTILLTALQTNGVTANTGDAPKSDKKEDR